ncbi:ubiquinol-cytochrome-c reductase complex assembly factor 1 [Anopheles darlingi]|uniref:ubiquinol-cytochrome-c reductase complex assembly factor 1 n=1 Tax=Anopheles darlingi TaxID=43151 RepID=UPI00210021BF|nr:ubiquinol-cytochrome-c reductase complex assembly factor 1 [Anopheles darlingi]
MLRSTARFAASLQQDVRALVAVTTAANTRCASHSYQRPASCTLVKAQEQQQRFLSTGQTSLAVSTNVDEVEQKEGFLKRFITKMGWIDNSAVRLRVSSCLLYESVADSINYNEFFTQFDMPDTFNTWFLITELHVWMLLVRSMAEGSEKGAAGRYLRNSIVETMWNDVTTRAKQLTMDNPSVVRPQIQQLSEQFQAALISYDEGISFDDKALAAALWRRFLGGRCEDYQKLEMLVEYVRKQTTMLDQLSRYDFAIKPKVKWGPLVDSNRGP